MPIDIRDQWYQAPSKTQGDFNYRWLNYIGRGSGNTPQSSCASNALVNIEESEAKVEATESLSETGESSQS
uniref:Uncharacterized protein n=1 Tax=Arundo donax TaxID=35708 RepID=A0A0A9BUZ4_ARUDO